MERYIAVVTKHDTGEEFVDARKLKPNEDAVIINAESKEDAIKNITLINYNDLREVE